MPSTLGGCIVLQFWHGGRISHPTLQPDGALPVAPSAIRPAGSLFTGTALQPFVTPRALHVDEVASVWGASRVGVRISPISQFNDMHDSDPARTFDYVARRLSQRDVAYLHVVETGPDAFDWVTLRRRFDGAYMANRLHESLVRERLYDVVGGRELERRDGKCVERGDEHDERHRLDADPAHDLEPIESRICTSRSTRSSGAGSIRARR